MAGESDDNADLWVFAYGSLMWRPGFEYAARVRGRLDGFRRAFCMTSIHYRGTVEAPGLVLALDPEPGAACEGIVYCVAAAARAEVLAYLRARELISYAYAEGWHPVILDGGGTVSAVTYVMNQAHEQYCGHLPLDAQADIIAARSGTMGSNADYLYATVDHLAEMNCLEPDLATLADMVRARRP